MLTSSWWVEANWVQTLGLALGAQLLGHALFDRVVKNIGPTVVSTLILLEVLGVAIIAAIVLGEAPR